MRFAALVAAAAVVLAGASHAGAQTLPRVRVAGLPIDVAASVYYAQAQGLFKKHGIDVEIVPSQNGAATAAALAGGSLDIGSGNTTSIALGHQNGLGFVYVAPSGAYRSSTPTSALIVYKNGQIKSAKDLAGKTIGVNGLKSIGTIAIQAWLDKNGVASTSVHFLEIPYGQMDAALVSGRIDAALAEEPWVAAITDADGKVLARPYDAIAPEFLEGGYFVMESYAKTHADVIKRFADAIAEVAPWANAHHAETAAILDQNAKAKLAPNVERIFYPARLTVGLLQPLIDASAKYGVLKASFPAKEIMFP